MRKQRTSETTEERSARLKSDAQKKSDAAAAEDAAVDEKIRRNLEQFGP